jgi:hypothetical protein
MAPSDSHPRSRRSHGDGGLYFDEHKGLWAGALELGLDGTGTRQRIKVTGRTKAEARTQLSDARRKVEAGLPLGDHRTTVGQFLDQWLKDSLPSSAKSANTIDNYRWAVESHIEPALGAKRLRDLSPEDIDRMLAAKAGSGMSRSSMARIHGTLQRALRHAERAAELAATSRRSSMFQAGPRARAGRSRSSKPRSYCKPPTTIDSKRCTSQA